MPLPQASRREHADLVTPLEHRTQPAGTHVVPQPRTAPAEDDVSRGDLIVVGVDGSDRSVDALVWALRLAQEEDRPVLVVTAWPLRQRVFVHEIPGHFNEARWEAREAQARVIARARSLVADAPRIESTLVNAPVLGAIVALAAPHRLVVLGTDRTGQRPSSSSSITARAQVDATGPILLVPPPAGDDDR